MTTCIVGCNGNMGRRYTAILEYLNEDFCGRDINEPPPLVQKYIIATPTRTHVDIIKYLKTLSPDASILCEKPITKNIEDFNQIPKKHWETVFMVNNYQYISYPQYSGETQYNFYNSGGDGIAWDCIQLIHLAKENIQLKNASPFWTCIINGFQVGKGAIDQSYVLMLEDFLSVQPRKLWNLHEAYEAHKKVLRLYGEQ